MEEASPKQTWGEPQSHKEVKAELGQGEERRVTRRAGRVGGTPAPRAHIKPTKEESSGNTCSYNYKERCLSFSTRK